MASTKPRRSEAARARGFDDVTESVEQCLRILELLDELPEAADEFAGSVRESVNSMMRWLQENRRVTDRQQQALDNWEAACGRWLEPDGDDDGIPF